ncbi:3-oxoacyl-[acyl-carrier-protein] reductase [Nocardioidaceae bacterium Broad-1]|uniref:SDR family NAD(P)-dependent oxidoreductase n=1 Tax=Nocardioides luteus TaxID=1844 RepID=UPI00020283F5|nr:SDR family NAD(P)-dependent oxidoreductase [Nocardioides luteus]EGD40076.1 3-oxoacyl-[acyl-carrier-protein] reductase [Nocardioidaceae bacterium Broad-1]MBG6095486.1 NAD(P)-dependent dehydrogenase (short-subunit alcohol dehydrogenase family) [Nocardioides luteus]
MTNQEPAGLHPGRLEGKRVLITGTAGGQGAAAQRLFAEHGATVIGCDIQTGAAERTAEQCRADGLDARGFDVDLSDADAAAAWVERAATELGGIDVLYNNGAGYGFAPFARMTQELWRHVMDVELNIIFNTTSVAWPYLCDGGGVVINTASYSALRGIAPLGQVAHSAAKGAVVAMTRSLAAEGGEFGVRVNAISPGFVATPATDAVVDPQAKAWQLGNKLIQRAGTSDDIAYLALYLASDESGWVTGQNICIDGGATAGWRDDAESRRIAALYA